MKSVVPLVLVALFWNGLVGAFDGMLGYQLYQQHQASSSYESVQARIQKSEVEAHRSSDGTSFRPDIEFSYEFDGQDYVSDRHSFFAFGTSDSTFAKEACRQYPEGASVTAYVDPDDPMEAVLDIGLDGFPAGVLLFLMPFNLIGLALIGAIVAALRKPQWTDEREEFRARYVVVDTGAHVVFGKPRMSPALIACIAMFVATFLAIFAVVPIFGFHASFGVVLTTLGLCAGASVAFTLWRVKKAKAPENFLHLDHTRGTFSYPANVPGELLESIASISHESEATGVTINDVKQYKHSFGAETPSGLVKLFEVRTSQDEGGEVLDLLRSELLGSGPETD